MSYRRRKALSLPESEELSKFLVEEKVFSKEVDSGFLSFSKMESANTEASKMEISVQAEIENRAVLSDDGEEFEVPPEMLNDFDPDLNEEIKKIEEEEWEVGKAEVMQKVLERRSQLEKRKSNLKERASAVDWSMLKLETREKTRSVRFSDGPDEEIRVVDETKETINSGPDAGMSRPRQAELIRSNVSDVMAPGSVMKKSDQAERQGAGGRDGMYQYSFPRPINDNVSGIGAANGIVDRDRVRLSGATDEKVGQARQFAGRQSENNDGNGMQNQINFLERAMSKGPILKPAKFTGKSNGLNARHFLMDFENAAKMSGWDEEMKVAFFCDSLEAGASSPRAWFFREQERLERSGQVQGWAGWKRAFLKRFDSTAERKEILANLKDRVFEENENADDYINDVVELCEKMRFDEETKIDYLVAGLAQRPEMDVAVSTHDFEDVETFARYLRRLSASAKLKRNVRPAAERRADGKVVNERKDTGMGQWEKPMRVEAGAPRAGQSGQRTQAPAVKSDGQRTVLDSGKQRSVGEIDWKKWVLTDGSFICTKCHERGHTSRNCQTKLRWKEMMVEPPKSVVETLEAEISKEQAAKN